MNNHMKRYCKLTLQSEKDRYKQMDVASGKKEIRRQRDKVKNEARKRLLEFGTAPAPSTDGGYLEAPEPKFHY